MRVFFVIFVSCLCLQQVSYSKGEGNDKPTPTPTNENPSTQPTPTVDNTTAAVNKTGNIVNKRPMENPDKKGYKSMTSRVFYVIIAASSIVAVYFIIRTIRVRRGKRKAKKYGVVASAQGDMELQPLDEDDDDDDDMTVFDRSMQNHK